MKDEIQKAEGRKQMEGLPSAFCLLLNRWFLPFQSLSASQSLY